MIQKELSIVRLIFRLLLFLVSLVLFGWGLFFMGSYLADEHAPKVQVTAQVIANSADSRDKILSYNYEGKNYKEQPLDRLLHTYGKIGDSKEVYIRSDKPQRLFLKNPPTGELKNSLYMIGWGLLALLIVYGEWRLMRILKMMNAVESSQNRSEKDDN